MKYKTHKNQNRAADLLKIDHLDLYPAKEKTSDRFNYALGLVDRYSRPETVFLIKRFQLLKFVNKKNETEKVK